MRHIGMIITFSGGLILAQSVKAEAKCKVDYYQLFSEGTSSTNIRITRGSTCASRMRSTGGLERIIVTRRPSHGLAGSASVGEWGYKPDAGYQGKDYFQLKIYYKLPTGQLTYATLNVDVDIE